MAEIRFGAENARKTRAAGAALIGAVVIAFVAARIATGSLPVNTLPDALRDGFALVTGVFLEAFPFVVLGVMISTIVQVWVPGAWILKILPQNSWARRAVLSLFGVFLPVCECGNVPLARGLMRRGLTPAESLVFLFAAPILNPVTIITTYQAFGFSNGVLISRILGGFLIANLIGFLVSRIRDQNTLLKPDFAAECTVLPINNTVNKATNNHANHTHRTNNNQHKKHKIGQATTVFTKELGTMLPALAFGAIVAALAQIAIPREILTSLGAHPVFSVLALIALAFLVSICSSVDAFFILGFASVFLPGGIAAFLIAGAMIDLKMFVLLRTTLRTRALAWIVAIIAMSCVIIGFTLNLAV